MLEQGVKSETSSSTPIILLKKQPKRLDPNEIKARKTSADKLGAGSQDERSGGTMSPTPKDTGPGNRTILNQQQTDKPSQRQTTTKQQIPMNPQQQTEKQNQQPTTHITSKVAQAISAVKAKVIPPKVEKEKAKAETSLVRKNSNNSDKSNNSNNNIALIQNKELKHQEQKPATVQTTSLAHVSANNNRLVAEVKPMQIINTRVTSPLNQGEEEVRNETVKKAAERFEKETMEANKSSGTGGVVFGAYRERSKSIGHSLAHKMATTTDVEDVDFEDDDATVSSLPWANQSGGGKATTPAVVRKRNSMRGGGAGMAYQLRMSKSSDSITAAKMLAEARMRANEEEMTGPRVSGARSNYHHQPGKTLRINAQHYGGVGNRVHGEMSKSIEKQIDVYTKTREDIRRILNIAKQCSVAERVKLLDNQQNIPELISPEAAGAEGSQTIGQNVDPR